MGLACILALSPLKVNIPSPLLFWERNHALIFGIFVKGIIPKIFINSQQATMDSSPFVNEHKTKGGLKGFHPIKPLLVLALF